MFGFGKNARDPLADAKAAERWFATFPANDPLAAHAEVLAELGRLAEPSAKRTPQHLDAVFFIDSQCVALRKSLTLQYIEHASRSSKIEHQLWSALFDLTQEFLVTYYAFSREIVAATVKEFGRLDSVWNHLGIPGPSVIDDLDGWDMSIDLNLRSQLVTTHAANPIGKFKPKEHYIDWVLKGLKQWKLPEDCIEQWKAYKPA